MSTVEFSQPEALLPAGVEDPEIREAAGESQLREAGMNLLTHAAVAGQVVGLMAEMRADKIASRSEEAQSYFGGLVRERSGTIGIAALAVGVAAWDAFADETISNAYNRFRKSENPVVSAAAWATLGVTVAHLTEALPQRVDPFHKIGNIIGKAKSLGK